MTVRRLAADAVQPAGFAFNRDNAVWAEATIGKYPEGRQASAVIPLLMRAQEQEGWVTRSAIEHVADMLEMPYIRVLEVATFYTQFQLAPVGTKAHVQVCGTTPCMLRGAEDLINVCKARINAQPFHTNESGTLSWEEVECQGACVNAPMVMVFKDTYEDLTPERLEEIIDDLEAGRPVEPGPQNGRIYSAPISGPRVLTDEKEIRAAARKDHPHKDAGPVNGDVAPSRAAKPKTDAPETDPRLKSPSARKVDPAKEKAASVEAPAQNDARADEADPAVEGEARPRGHSGNHPKDSPAHEAPEAKHEAGSAPVGVAMPESPARKAGTTATSRPQGTDRPAQPDDLKLLAGVDPQVEEKLNALGIWTYGQIAVLKKPERLWVDDHLNFNGRIERDDWVKQAKALAKGGEAEYVRVFGKKPR